MTGLFDISERLRSMIQYRNDLSLGRSDEAMNGIVRVICRVVSIFNYWVNIASAHRQGDKGVDIDWDAPEDLHFLGERQDLLEIAGNAIENACKWSRSRVRVRAEGLTPERLRLTVEDDGAGLPPDRREEVVRRGARLDENAPGSGLGLSIIDELARAYGGVLTLGDAALGGLKVEIELPRAEA